MKPHFIKICSITLILTIIVTSFCTLNISATETDGSFEHKPNMQSLFAKTEDINGVHFYGVTGDTPVDKASMPDDIEVIDSLDEYIKYINDNQTSKKDIATLSASNLPDSVDNSQSKFFPAIGNQGTLGSCTSWAQVYYQFTYTMNKEMNVATTPDNTFSPQWAYNLVAGTGDMIGPYYNTYAFMKKQGNVFLNQVPYDFNVTSFSPTEDIWKTSIKYRIKDYQNFNDIGLEDSRITTANDEDLTLIKTALNNGDVLAYSTCIYSWQTTSIKTKSEISENNKFKGQYAVTSQIGESGPHRMTLVGYNDNIWIDVNNNNAVDNGEMGAFKIANSWGSNYGNNGFMWIAYDALNKESCVDGITNNDSRRAIFESISRIEVYPYNTGADLYLRYTLNTCDRTQCRVYLDAEKDGTIYSTPAYSNEYGGSKLAYDGSTNATDATMVLLLSNAVEGITADNLNEYTWRVRFEDTSEDGNIYTIKNAEIISEKDNKVYRPKDVYPITLDGNSKEVMLAEDNLNRAVIYYRGYDNPMLSYKVGNGNFTTDVELIHNAERRGYTHKYVIDLGSSDSATVYFSDSKGNTDNNSGKYFKATDGLNYFVTENVGTPVSLSIENNINNLADVDQYGTFEVTAKGGYAPYQYKFICTNLSTNEEQIEEFDENSSQGFYFRKEGKYRITAEIMDYSDKIYTTYSDIEVKDIPFSIDKLYIDNGCALVGEEVAFKAISKNEKIIYRGYSANEYKFVIKDESNNTLFTDSTKCISCNLNDRNSIILQNWTPEKAGKYTVTISSTDGNKEYAEKTISFTVINKIYGDSDANGYINVLDATKIQMFTANLESGNDIYKKMADCDLSGDINILDATVIQNYVASLSNTGVVGQIIEYIKPTEPPTQESTSESTQKPTAEQIKNTVTFTNSFNWAGTIYCYYWSDSNTAMTSWPGKAMTNAGKNDYSQTLYTFEVPSDAKYIIFSNGSAQTTDINYNGGEIRYYPIQSTDSKGHNLVETW